MTLREAISGSSAFHVSTFVVAIAALVALVSLSGLRLEHRLPATKATKDLIYLPRADFLKAVSLGYNNALADILWFRTISYFGEHYAEDRDYPWLADMCDLVTDLDPKAEHVYRFAGVVLPWEANEIDAGNRVLEKGLKVFPDAWNFHYWLGFNHYFFKNDYRSAAKHMRAAAELEGAPAMAARFAVVLQLQQEDAATTLQLVDEMIQTTESREMKEVLRGLRRNAKLNFDLDRLQQAVDFFRQRAGQIPPSVRALVDAGVIQGVPQDPFGGTYIIDPSTGLVSSTSGQKRLKLHDSIVKNKHRSGRSRSGPLEEQP